ncbi:Hypothetical protein GLP15_5087 [Giardia lamblia P15]|uniref:Uncharacterized protein n=1 Tax=Giardia intestinalis (strain P15) TaxID=658858 RepID=E1F7F7_GIAIA|nr:Hypothetical protein GLP15_5087 [Giardia lamblia P15]
MSVPVPYTDIPNDFSAWLKTERENGAMGRALNYKLSTYLSDVYNIATVTDPEVIENIAFGILRAITSKDPIPSKVDSVNSKPQSPSAGKMKSGGATSLPKKDTTPAALSYQIDLMSPEPYLEGEAFFYSSSTALNADYKAMRITMLNILSFATSQSIIAHPDPTSANILHIAVELAHRAILANHISPTSCLPLSMTQFLATASFIECLCVSIERIVPLVWKIAKEYTDAQMQQRPRSPSIQKVVSESTCHEITCMLSCISGFLKIFLGHYDELLLFIEGRGGSGIELYPVTIGTAMSDKAKGKDLPVSQFDCSRFNLATSNRELLQKITRTYLHLSNVLCDALHPILGTFSVHRIVVPCNLCEGILSFHAKYESLLTHLQKKFDFLQNGFAYLRDHISDKNQLPPDYLAYCELLTGVPRKPASVEAANMASSNHYAVLTKDYLTICNSFMNISKLAGLCCTVLLFSEPYVLTSVPEDGAQQSDQIGAANTARIIQSPDSYSFSESLLVAALSTCHRTPRSQKLPSQDDCAAVISFCHLPIAFITLSLDTTESFPDFFPRKTRSPALVTALGTFISTFSKIYNQSIQCSSLVSGRPIYRYDIRGDTLTYHPDVMCVIQSIVINAIAFDSISVPEKSDKNGDKKQSFISGYTLETSLSSLVPIFQPLLTDPPLQVSCYLALGSFTYLLLKYAQDQTKLYSVCLAVFLDMNKQFINLPTTQLLIDGPPVAELKRPPSTSVAKKGDKKIAVVETVTTLSEAVSMLTSTFKDSFPLTFTLLYDLLYLGVATLYAIGFNSTYPTELYTSKTVTSVLTLLENLYLLLASKHIALDNCNEPVDILLSSAKTYLEYARFNTVVFPYESQGLCPESAKMTGLVHRIYSTAYETAKLLVDRHRTGRVSTPVYSRRVADITIGLILLFKRAMRLTRIEIADQLFELYKLVSSAFGSSVSQTIKSMDVSSADKELFTVTRDLVATASGSAGQQLLLKQTAMTQLSLCVDDMFFHMGPIVKHSNAATQLPPTTMVQPTQWMQMLVSLCIKTLMLHTRYSKCVPVFQANMFLVASSYELSLYYLVLLTATRDFNNEIRPFIASLNLPEVQMVKLLFAGIKLFLSLPEVRANEYTRLSENVLFLLETTSLRLEALFDTQARGKFSLAFSALKYSVLIQLGLYLEEEHDTDLLELISKESKPLFIEDNAPVALQPTSRPASRTATATKQGGKQTKTTAQPNVDQTIVRPSISEDIVSLSLSYLVRKSKLTPPSDEDLQVMYLYHRLMAEQAISAGWQSTESMLNKNDPSAYTEQYLLELLKGLNSQAELESAVLGHRGLFQGLSMPISMVGPSHTDTCILVLSDYVEMVVLQQHTFLNDTSQLSSCSYGSIVVMYAAALIETIRAYLFTLTWYSFATALVALQFVFAWLRDYGTEQLWSLLAAQLDNFVINNNLFTGFERFSIESSRCGFGSLMLRHIQSKILIYAINSTLWGSIYVGSYILNETSIGTESLNISLFEHALHKLCSGKVSTNDEQAPLQPLQEELTSYIILCHAPRLLLEGIIEFFQSRMVAAQCTIHALDLLMDEGTCQIALSHITERVSAELTKKSGSLESPLHSYVPHLSVDYENESHTSFYLSFPLMDIYLRLATAVRLLVRADMESFQAFLWRLLSRTKQFSSQQDSFRSKHLATVRSLKPCSPLQEEKQLKEKRTRFLSDYTTVGIGCYLFDSLVIQRAKTLQSTILECFHACNTVAVYGDCAYWRENQYAAHFFNERDDLTSTSEKFAAEGGILPDVLDAGSFINNVSIQLLQAGALGMGMGCIFSDYTKYSLLFIRPNRVILPTSGQLHDYHSFLIECIAFVEDALGYLSDHPVEQSRIMRLSILIIAALLMAPHISLMEFLTDTSLDKVHVSLAGMAGKRLELAALILLKLTSPSFVLGNPHLKNCPLRRQLELLKAVILERLAFIVETIPEQIQDIVLGSKLVTDHVVARWLTETTSSFVFDPTSMSVVEYCRNPTSFCVHLPSLLFASNKALLASGFCKLDFTDLNLNEIPTYSSSNDRIKKKATTDLELAISDATDFTIQLLRLVLTRGPFKQVQTGVVPFVDAIVARYGRDTPLFTEALPGLLADLNNGDKKSGAVIDKKGDSFPLAYGVHSLPQAIFALSTLTGLYRQGFKEFLRVTAQIGVCLLSEININEFISSRCLTETDPERAIALDVAYPPPSLSSYPIRLICIALLSSLDLHAATNGHGESVQKYIDLLNVLAKADSPIPNFVQEMLDGASLREDDAAVGSTEKGASTSQKKTQHSSASDNTSNSVDLAFSTREFRLLTLFYGSLQILLSISTSYSHGPFVLEVLDHLIYSRLSRAVTSPSLSDSCLYLTRASILTEIQSQILSQIVYMQSQKFIGPTNLLSNIVWGSGAIIGYRLLTGARTSNPIILSASLAQDPQLSTLSDSHYNDLLSIHGEYVFTHKRPPTAPVQGSGKDLKGKTQQVASSILLPDGSLTMSPDFLAISPDRAHIFKALFHNPIAAILASLDARYLKLQHDLLTAIESALPGISEKSKTITTSATTGTGIYLQLTCMIKWTIMCYIQKDVVTIQPIKTPDSSSFSDEIAKVSLRYTDWYGCARKLMASYWNYVPAAIINQLQTALSKIEADMDPDRETIIVKNLFVYLKSIRKGMSRLYYKHKSARSRASSALGQSEVAKTKVLNDTDSTPMESNLKTTRPLSSATSQRSVMSPKTIASAKLVNTAELYGFVPFHLKKANDLLHEIVTPLCDDLRNALPQEATANCASNESSVPDSTDAKELCSLTFILSDYSICCLPYTMLLNIVFSNLGRIRVIVPRLKDREAPIEPEILASECCKGNASIDVHDDLSFALSSGLNLAFADLIPFLRGVFNCGNPLTNVPYEVMQSLNESSLVFICSFAAPRLLLKPSLVVAKPTVLSAVKKIAILHSEFEFSNMRSKRELLRSPSLQFIDSDFGMRLSLLSSGPRIIVMNEVPLSPTTITSITVLYLLDYLKQRIDESLKKNKPPTAQEKKPQGAKKPAVGVQETQVSVEPVDLTDMCTKLLRGREETLLFNSVATYVSQ